MRHWNGVNLGGLSRLSDAKSRSITAENRDGAKGGGARASAGTGSQAGRTIDLAWKVSPSEVVAPGAELVIADIEGPGVLQHLWMTLTGSWRDTILRVWWDGQEQPSIEVPAGDFFCMGFGKYAQVNAVPVNVNPGSGFNCWWEMPFRERCRVSLENRSAEELVAFYQLDYALTEVPDDCAYFHAQWRRAHPARPGVPIELLDGVRGRGHFVGTYLAWEARTEGWWGEGELQFFLDGDEEHPTICGTGTEDYFGGSYNFELEDPATGARAYREFSAPFVGMPQVLLPNGPRAFPQRFGLYRFHLLDPVRFERDLRVTVQCLGWSERARGFELRQDDVASTAFWYQTLPSAPFPTLPGRAELALGE